MKKNKYLNCYLPNMNNQGPSWLMMLRNATAAAPSHLMNKHIHNFSSMVARINYYIPDR